MPDKLKVPDDLFREEDTKPGVPPIKEIEKKLDGILGWIQKKKALASTTNKPATKVATGASPSKPWGIVVGLVISVVVFVGLAILAWGAWKKGREIAKLKHERDVAEEKERQKKVDAGLSKTENERKRLEDEASAIRHTIHKTEAKIQELEKKRMDAHTTIDTITSWDDLDQVVGGPS